jgi:transposase-like protein
MKKKSTKVADASRVVWNNLEAVVRGKVQGFLQEILEEELTEFLGREKSERLRLVDAVEGYRNGHGKPRKLTMSCGTVTLRRPRVRGLEERFESRVLPYFKRRTKEVSELLPELYLHGLAHGDFDLALRGLLGDEAPLSASTVARLKEKWQVEYDEWSLRSLRDLEVVYLWVDGVYVKAGLEKEKAALLVAVAGCADGHKEIVSLVAGHRESEQAWSTLMRDLRDRGMGVPRLVIGDGHLGIWAGLCNIFPEAEEQRCWNHRVLNVLDRIAKRYQRQASLLLRAIPYAETLEEAEKLKGKFQLWCRQRGQESAAALLDQDWDRMVTFYRFPREHWQHLRTSNVIESPFAALRLRTDAAKRFKKVANATAVIFKMLLVSEKKFRRLNSPELMREVYIGVKFEDGVRIEEQRMEAAA